MNFQQMLKGAFTTLLNILLVAFVFFLGLLPVAAQVSDTSKPELVLKLNHTGAADLLSFAISPDGKTFATLGKDGVINLWNAASGRLQKRLARLDSLGELGGPARDYPHGQLISFTPQGEWLIFHGAKMNAWQLATGNQARMPAAAKISKFVFAPDGQTMAGISNPRQIVVWEAQTGQVKNSFEAHQAAVSNFIFVANGERLLTSSAQDKVVKLWDWKKLQIERQFELDKLGREDWALSPDGLLLAVKHGIRINVWDTQNWQLKGQLNEYDTVMVFSPNSRFLAAMSFTGEIGVLDLQTGKASKLDLQVTTAEKAANLRDLQAGKIPSSAKEIDTLGIQRLDSQKQVVGVAPFTFTSDSRFLRALCLNGKFAEWEVLTGALKFSIDVPDPLAQLRKQLALEGLGKQHSAQAALFVKDALAIGLAGKEFGEAGPAFKLTPQTEWKTFAGEDETSSPTILSRDGRLQAKLQPDATIIKVWDQKAGKMLYQLAEKTGAFHQVQFSPDGKWLFTTALSAATIKGLQEFLAETQRMTEADQPAETVPASKTPARASKSTGRKSAGGNRRPATAQKKQSSPDQKFAQALMGLATPFLLEQALANEQGQTIKIWNAETGALAKVIEGYRGTVMGMRFSPDGKSLITSHQEHTDAQALDIARIWDIASGQLKQRIAGACGLGNSLLYAENNSIIISCERSECDEECTKKTLAEIEQLRKAGKEEEAQARYSIIQGTYEIVAWDVASARRLWNSSASGFPFRELKDLLLAPNGRYLAQFLDGKVLGLYREEEVDKKQAVRKGSLNLWETATGKLVHQHAVTLDDIFNFNGETFSQSGKFFAGWSSGQVFLWDVAQAKPAGSWNMGYETRLRPASFSANDRLLASASFDGSVKLRDLANGEVLLTVVVIATATAKGPVEWIAYTPAGYYTGSAGIEKHLLWQANGQLQAGATHRATFHRPDLIKAILALAQ